MFTAFNTVWLLSVACAVCNHCLGSSHTWHSSKTHCCFVLKFRNSNEINVGDFASVVVCFVRNRELLNQLDKKPFLLCPGSLTLAPVKLITVIFQIIRKYALKVGNIKHWSIFFHVRVCTLVMRKIVYADCFVL